MRPLCSSMKKWFRKEQGSFTLEASMVFPIILIITVCLVLFSLVIYEKVVLEQRAHVIAERVAYAWDNSQKDPATGSFGMNEYTTNTANGDGLYWRLTSDRILDKLLQRGSSASDPVPIGGGEGGSLPDQKLSNVADDILPNGAQGTIAYQNSFWGREIVVELERSLNIPEFAQELFGGNLVIASASASISEPVEVIRNTDLVITYGQRLEEHFQILQGENNLWD